MEQSTRMRSAAEIYATRLGFAVFPLAPRSKIPAIAGGRGCLDATRDLALIRRWWQRMPDANVGLAMGAVSGVFALDLDPRNGGEDTLPALEDRHGTLPDTIVSLTGSGGRHLLFRYDPTLADIRWVPLGPGLDVKGDGGYIVGPPSIHPNGRPYAWELTQHPLHVRPAEAPGWMLDMLRANRRAGGPESRLECPPVEFALGQLFQAAGWLGAEVRPGMWRARCPSAVLHSMGEDYDGSTVLFAPNIGSQIGHLHCSHEHCRGLYGSYDQVVMAVQRATGIRWRYAREVGGEG